MIEHYPLIILGAGPTGIGAALHAKEIGADDFVMLEATDRAGGLSASFRDETGFTWDRGVHLQFSHYQKYDEFLDRVLPPEEWVFHKRDSSAWLSDRFVPYPVQFNLHHLEGDDRWECLQGLLAQQNVPRGKPAHFLEWIEQAFGAGIAEKFLIPYNEKIWATPLERMNARWMGERVAVPKLEDVLQRLCLERSDSTWGPNAQFRYPRRGGTGLIWSEAARLIPNQQRRYADPVVEIDADEKLLRTFHGRQYRYDSLISTMPLPSLLERVKSRERLPSAARLEATQTELVGIGIEGELPESLREKIWVYYPDPAISFYRLTLLGNLSPQMVPEQTPHWSVLVEIASGRWRRLPQESLVARVEADLLKLELLSGKQKIVSRWRQTLPFGYPVPTLERDRVLSDVLPALETLGIYSRGRFGAWKYEVSNQDHSFMQGVEVVEKIVNRQPELTLTQPALVNSRHNSFPYSEWSHA